MKSGYSAPAMFREDFVQIVTADKAGIARAARALVEGQLVGMPTETVYGLAANARDPAAVARIFAAKGRPSFNPLIAHVASLEAAENDGRFNELARRLAEAFWPGPLTLIVPVQEQGTVCDLARAGLDTIGLRVPAHPVAQSLLNLLDFPLAAPSANPSGRLSPTTAQDVAEELSEELGMVLDGGQCVAGIESSIVTVLPDQQPQLLRPGAIERSELEAVVGPLMDGASLAVMAPGQLASHYAPRARLRLNAGSVREGEVLLGFGPGAPAKALNLSARGDTVEAAANLYQMMRQLDSHDVAVIAVMPIPDSGLGQAINDRLRRAAAPRSE